MITLGKSPKNCCKKCHFLAKSYIAPNGQRNRFTWDDTERSNLQIANYCAAECAKGVWSTGIDPHLGSRFEEILLEDKMDNCFLLNVV